MTWIGRDCDLSSKITSAILFGDQNLWPELEGIVTCRVCVKKSRILWISEFMTWIGRDCDHSLCVIPSPFFMIRIYDLNWKGLWHPQGPWPFNLNSTPSEFMTWIGRDCDCRCFHQRWHRRRRSEFMTWIGRDCDFVAPFFDPTGLGSEFMTWIGRDCDLAPRSDRKSFCWSEFMTWIGRDCDSTKFF